MVPATGVTKSVPTPSAAQAQSAGDTEAVNADEDWRKRQPRGGKLGKLSLPVPHAFKLAQCRGLGEAVSFWGDGRSRRRSTPNDVGLDHVVDPP